MSQLRFRLAPSGSNSRGRRLQGQPLGRKSWYRLPLNRYHITNGGTKKVFSKIESQVTGELENPT